MPARDNAHQAVVRALKRDGWTVTHDPLRLLWQGKALFVDVGAERMIAAERGMEKIAVEIKSFPNPNAIHEIHPAAGQYIFYRSILKRLQPERILYLAIPEPAFERLFDRDRVGAVLLQDEQINIIVFNSVQEEIVEWVIS